MFAAAVPYGGGPFELRMPQAGGRTCEKFFEKTLDFWLRLWYNNDSEREVIQMYCGKCGNDNNKVITQEVEQDGNTVAISYYGVCEKCGEPLGIKEFFTQTSWDYIDKENVKKALDKYRKVCYNV